MKKTLVGIEIGGTKLQIVTADSPAGIGRRWRADADRAGGAAIQRQIEGGLRSILGSERAAAIGVGFGGPVDSLTGRIRTSHQISGWDGFPIRDWLAGMSGSPVVVENDSNVAAFAEATLGAGMGLSPCFYTNFGSGVGGGLVVDGQIYHGAPPGEIEFGHLLLDRSGATVESICSGWAVDRQLRTAAEHAPASPLAVQLGSTVGGEARHLSSLLAAGDTVAITVLRDLSANIAFALSHVVHLVHPRVIVLGGGLALVGEPFRSGIEAALAPLVMEAFRPAPEVRLSKLREDAVPIGALELAARIAKIG